MDSFPGSGLSTSYQAALEDPLLKRSLSDSRVDVRAREALQDDAKFKFEELVKRYYIQLTSGCGFSNCQFKLCASCAQSKKVNHDLASILSVQLATKPKKLLCPRIAELAVAELEVFFPRSRPQTPEYPGENPGNERKSQKAPVAASFLSSGLAGTRSFLGTMLSFSSLCHLFEPSDGASEEYASDESPEFSQDEGNSNVPKSKLTASGSLFDVPPKALQDPKSRLKIPMKSASYDDLPLLQKSHRKQKDQMKQGTGTLYREILAAKSRNSALSQANSMESLNSIVTDTDSLLENPAMELLTYSLFERAVDIYSPELLGKDSVGGVRDPSFLLDSISAVFSSRRALSMSFLREDDHDTLDIRSLQNFFSLFSRLTPQDTFQTRMVDAIEILLSKLIKNIPVLQGCERNILRILLIVMECPLLEKKDLEELLLKKLCQILGSLRSKPRGVMGEWLSQYPQEQFKRLVRIFKRFLANHFFPGPKPDEAVVYSVKILSMLCHANEKHSPPLVPVDDFYVPELCSGLQFKEEYKNWTENTSGETFSYFNFPFLFDPSSKARIIKLDAIHEMSHQFEQAYVSQALISHAQKFLEDSSHLSDLEKHMKSAANPFLVLELHRETLLQDTIEQLRRKALDLKKPIRIKFIGGGEEGMDQGGVQKEFFSFAIMELLDPAHGLFLYDEETRQSWINRSSVEPDSFYELFGILLGLAIYNGIMLGVSLPLVFYMKLLDETITIHDFEDSFPSLGKGLHSLLKWSDGDVEDVFMRSFEITYSDFSGVRNVQLVDDGENIPVTNSNREEFVNLYMDHYINKSVARQFKALKTGFLKVCSGRALGLCRSSELELLICGLSSNAYNYEDLMKVANYDDGYSEEHEEIQWFWNIVKDFSLDLKRKLLLFVTASDRIPLNGLQSLTFVIQRNGPDSDRLPTSLTCFGRLLLPEYDSQEKLRERLVTAIENAAGFGLV